MRLFPFAHSLKPRFTTDHSMGSRNIDSLLITNRMEISGSALVYIDSRKPRVRNSRDFNLRFEIGLRRLSPRNLNGATTKNLVGALSRMHCGVFFPAHYGRHQLVVNKKRV